MTATNHFLTGVLVAAMVKQPALAIPLAFCSHFALDTLPHYGNDSIKNYKKMWLSDGSLLISIIVYYVIIGWSYWALLAGFAATSPDLVWVYRFIFKENLGKIAPGPKNKFNYFHSSIQKHEFSGGYIVEVLYFITIFSLLLYLR